MELNTWNDFPQEDDQQAPSAAQHASCHCSQRWDKTKLK